MQTQKRNFYIVATPIGNLEDMTYRGVRILQNVDCILCEDTRTTRRILDRYDINTKTESYHSYSTQNKEQSIIRRVLEDNVVFALVSDAGTPTISDPGVKIIEALYEQVPDVDIISIPGPSAVVTALSITGFNGNQFTFYGFLPHKKGRQSLFAEMLDSDRISIFYESPHRILKTLEYLLTQSEVMGNRKICLARELTKLHEQKIRGTIDEVHQYFSQYPEKIRGEFVVIIDKK